MGARFPVWLPVRGELGSRRQPSRQTRYLGQTHYLLIKRIADVLIVILAAPAVLLLIAGIALLILRMMGRPVFFVQDRTGKDGRVFRIYKLRTMRHLPPGAVTATARNDPRVTDFGRFLRTSHLDELPQLWNIVKGDMTLVGPRPEQPKLVETYRAALPGYDLRHTVLPGLTGWAQVNSGYAADLDETRAKLEHDLYYVSNLGPAIDFKIMLRTILIYANPKYVR